MSTRSDASFLKDVLVAARRINAIVSGITQEAFLRDEIRQDWQILWVAAAEDVPKLQGQIAEILKNEFPAEAKL